MPPKRKIAQACKAMVGFGIPAAKVKAALKELLKVYDNQWKLIEDDHYRVLLDFMLENKPAENELLENKRKAPHSNVKAKEKSKKLAKNQADELPTKRLRTSGHNNFGSQTPQTSSRIARQFEAKTKLSSGSMTSPKSEENEPLAKRLRSMHHVKCHKNFGSRLEKPSSRIVQQCETKLSLVSVASSESEECEPLRKRQRPRHHIEKAPAMFNNAVCVGDTHLLAEIPRSTQSDDSKTNTLSGAQNILELEDSELVWKRPCGKWAQGEAEWSQTCWMEKVEGLSVLCIEGEQTIGGNEPSYKRTKLNCVSSRKKSKSLALSVTPSEQKVYTRRKNHVAAKDPWADHFFSPSAADNVLDLYHNPLNHLTEELCSFTPCNQYCGDEPPCGNCSEVQKDDTEFLHGEFSNEEAKVIRDISTNEAHFDIASSLKGEVKISLICNFSQQPNFNAPCLDDVLKVVDNKCCESYKITAPDFTAKLMMEVCQCFLAMGAGPVNTQSIKATMQSSCKNLDPQVHPSAKTDLQREFGIFTSLSMESVKVQNLFKLVPGIPRHPFHAWLDNIHYFISFGIDYPGRVLLEHRRIMLIESQNFPVVTPENMGAFNNNHSSLAAMSIEHVVDIIIGEKSLKISFANGSYAEFFYAPCNSVCKKAPVKITSFHISDADFCLSHAVDCLSLQIPGALAHKTWCKHSCTLEKMVKREFLEERVSKNRDTEERHLLCCKKHDPSSCKNRKILNVCCSYSARIFTKKQWSKYQCCKTHGNMVLKGGTPANPQIGSSEAASKDEEDSKWSSFQY